jgi:hypothetical protein
LRSIVAEQLAHVMPVTGSVTSFASAISHSIRNTVAA